MYDIRLILFQKYPLNLSKNPVNLSKFIEFFSNS